MHSFSAEGARRYPLYSATIALYGGTLLPYELDESHDWGMDIPALEKLVHQVCCSASLAYAQVCCWH